MKFRTPALFLCLILSLCTTAQAQDPYIAPEGQNVTYNGKDGIFFTLDEYKVWGHIYLDYVSLTHTNQLLTEKLHLQDTLVLNLQMQVKTLESLNNLYIKDREFYKDAYNASLKERGDQQLKADVEKYILYALLAAESIAMATMGINDAAKASP